MRTLCWIIFTLALCGRAAEPPVIVAEANLTPREKYGLERLRDALLAIPGARVTVRKEPRLGRAESFRLTGSAGAWLVEGADPSGVLYGCLELGRRITAPGGPPPKLNLTDGPAFKIRGTNLFWMKWGDNGYNWPVTRDNFPWFYDRVLMERYLDELVANGYNTIYFWNGHPFPFFLKLPRYPEARMLGEEELRRNMEHMKWFTEAADRRGIWTVLHFYNLHVSPSFAKAHEREGITVENRAATPLLSAYMRYVVSEFVSSYPSVGILITAGEALAAGKEEYVRDVIIAGIKDSGRKPPLIVRQWTISPERYRDIIKPHYDNLFTMMKHNTEMIVSPYPDPRNRTWISYGQSHVINVHLNTDIVPYRWGSAPFIQQMVQQWKKMGASGLHLYPLVCWLWPATMDRVEPPLSTVERDRIWIEAFGRYVWNPDRPADEEQAYWQRKLTQRFGSVAAGQAIYRYYVLTGPILPTLQNVTNCFNMGWYPISVSREASLNAILHSDRWEGVGDYLARPLDDVTLDLYRKKYGKLGEAARQKPPLSVKEFVEQQVAGTQVDSIAPPKLSALLVEMAADALAAVQAAAGSAGREQQEYARFLNDARCILHTAKFYDAKFGAAIEKGLYDNSGRREHLDGMLRKLAVSVKEYAALEQLATPSYKQASDIGEWYQWSDMRKAFEEESAYYREQAALGARGADVVWLGLDGPMSDASSTFHWLLEQCRKTAGLTGQSYAFGDNPFLRAKLVIVSDLFSPGYRRFRPQLEAWVRRGGKLVIWDPLARAGAGPIAGLSGTDVRFDSQTSFLTSMRKASRDWSELAYSVLPNRSGGQFANGRETFGPRWTSVAAPARVPLILVRRYAAGTVVIAQIGHHETPPRPELNPDSTAEVPPHLRQFVRNAVAWGAAH
ncbi:MAG: hypothetical protein NTY38_11110 [Acidobacteria bacterium]|nr:hypothetical protein [Acidobacteriota bacterium]